MPAGFGNATVQIRGGPATATSFFVQHDLLTQPPALPDNGDGSAGGGDSRPVLYPPNGQNLTFLYSPPVVTDNKWGLDLPTAMVSGYFDAVGAEDAGETFAIEAGLRVSEPYRLFVFVKNFGQEDEDGNKRAEPTRAGAVRQQLE